MSLKVTNNAKSNLSSALSESSTSLQVIGGAIFPSLSAGEWHPLTIIAPDGSYEIVRATARSGNTITIERGREGTSAMAFPAGAAVELRLTEEALQQFAMSGQQDFTVIRGTNYGMAAGTVGSGIYNVAISNINSYQNSLRISVLPHSANPSAVSSVNVNGIGLVDIRLADGSVPHAGAIIANRVMELRYVSSGSHFVIDNPVSASQANASTTTAGLAIRGTEEDFNPDGDNTKFTTQLTVSRIIEDSRDASQDFPFAWSYFGNARDGGTFDPGLPSNNGTINANDPFEVENLNVPAGQTLTINGSGTAIIRARTSITIGGTVVMARTNRVSDLMHVGPDGGRGLGQSQAVSQLASQRPSGNPEPMTDRELLSYIKNGIGLNHFHGGQGTQGNNTQTNVYAAGGLILISPTISIEAGANFMNMFSTPELDDDPANGGGIIVLAGNSVGVSASALYEAGAQGAINTGTHWNAQTNQNLRDNEPAHNGQVFVVSLLQDEVIKVF